MKSAVRHGGHNLLRTAAGQPARAEAGLARRGQRDGGICSDRQPSRAAARRSTAAAPLSYIWIARIRLVGLIYDCKQAVLSGRGVSPSDAEALINVRDEDLPELAAAADEITRAFNGDGVDVEQLNNIKKNACSEDCTFCGQSAFYDTGLETYALPPAEDILRDAQKARDENARSYCLVAAWRQPPADDFEVLCGIIDRINRAVGIDIECSLGFLTARQASRLAGLGVRRYNHNLETARSKFPEICSTHSYDDRLETLDIARRAGMELCTGGIIGMGETRAQRLELAVQLGKIGPEEVTINILVPVPGTPLELQAPMPDGEIARMFALLRFMLPLSIVKISGGRETRLDDDGRALLRGGANGIITSGYLTMGGNDARQDLAMIGDIGLGLDAVRRRTG